MFFTNNLSVERSRRYSRKLINWNGKIREKSQNLFCILYLHSKIKYQIRENRVKNIEMRYKDSF